MIDFNQVWTSLGEVGTTVLWIAMGAAVLEGLLYLLLVKLLKYKHALAFMLLAPAVIGLIALVVYPLIWELNLSFSNMSIRRFTNWEYVGFLQYGRVFSEPVLKQATFFQLLGQTALWTVINLFFHVFFGMILALLLNRKMRLRGLYRMLLIVPWAVPQVIAVLAWRGEFNFEYGFLNVMLKGLGLAPVAWLTNPTANFAAMCITNIWLGIPFMMVIFLGGLQSIAGEYYEAAEMDGANSWQQFWMVTMPLMRPVITPVVILGTVWTFNNFNVPFFINQNELETSDILVTALFRSAFQYNQYGFAAAFAFVNFALLALYSIWYLRVTGGLKGAYE
ncbi:MAG TPA: sugar ABC transporter permease [Anaerolineaceae bacterium]|nr:sugar ABC transporter permease [Anaerolineaceae bacterium]